MELTSHKEFADLFSQTTILSFPLKKPVSLQEIMRETLTTYYSCSSELRSLPSKGVAWIDWGRRHPLEAHCVVSFHMQKQIKTLTPPDHFRKRSVPVELSVATRRWHLLPILFVHRACNSKTVGREFCNRGAAWAVTDVMSRRRTDRQK